MDESGVDKMNKEQIVELYKQAGDIDEPMAKYVHRERFVSYSFLTNDRF